MRRSHRITVGPLGPLIFERHLSRNPWFELDVVVADPATPGIDVLVRMDVLSQLVLFHEGVDGTMVLTY